MKTVAGLVMLLMLAMGLPAQGAEQKQYIFAVLPQRPPVTMHTSWRPFLDQLEQETGVKFKLKLYETMNQFEAEFKQGVPDFAFSTPYQLMLVHRSQNYRPLVRGSHLLAGMLITRADSPIKELPDLDNKQIAYVGSRNVCSLSLRQILSQQNITLNMKEVFVGSSSNVYKMVLLGKTDAGTVLNVDFDAQPEDVKAKLRVLMMAPKIAPHPISAHPRTSRQVQQAVADAVLRMAGKPETNPLLKPVQLGKPVVAEYDRDYKALEKMDYDAMTKGI